MNQQFFFDDEEHGLSAFLIRPVLYGYYGIVLIRKSWQEGFLRYGVRKYPGLIKTHYSEQGSGYEHMDALTEPECMEVFKNLVSRLSYYIDHNKRLLVYQDGDSFLDVGCGKGENIGELVARYPNSLIKGFDVNKNALRIVQTGLKDNPHVQLEQGSAVDFNYLDSYPDNSFDHVIMSHVFSFLMDTSIQRTQILRQTIVDHLLRISRKTVIIMDANIISDDSRPKLIIEHNTRCLYREMLIPYFSKHLFHGEIYMGFGEGNSSACVFCFNT